MKKTFSMISLGCPRNLVDSECLVSEFKKAGYRLKERAIGADTVIINTCAFIEDAKKESIDTILKVIDAKKSGSVKRIIVAGCLPERYTSELESGLKEIDEFRGVLDFKHTFKAHDTRTLTPRHYAYLKISEGCRNTCTYCVIPRLKGPYTSRNIPSIVEEVERLVHDDVKEIILVGQDTSLYGLDLYGKKKLAELLKTLEGISGKRWLRLLYCHPANLDKDVIKVIRDSGVLCRYIDLPIEHINNKILKRMGRRISTADILSLINNIRSEIKDVAIRTSIIVGFPGETEKDFCELLAFIEETRFERLGLFKYSREEDTPAFRYEGQIPEKEKERRFAEAMSLQQKISTEINENFKGRTLKVLVERKEEDYYIGRTEYDAPEVDGSVYIKGGDLKLGTFYDANVIDTYEYDLVGKVTSGNRERRS